MAKYNISFNGTWDYSSNEYINIYVTFYDEVGNVVTDTIEAKQYELLDGFFDIDFEAFKNCPTLVSITLPLETGVIEQGAFSDCSSLESVILHDNVSYINSDAFANCPALTSIYVTPSSSLDSIKSVMGEYNPEIVSLMVGLSKVYGEKFPISFAQSWDFSSNTYVTDYVQFYNESGDIVTDTIEAKQWAIVEELTSLQLPIFKDCPALETIEFPNTVTSIGGGICENCSFLQSAVIPNGVTEIGTNSFKDCNWLAVAKIPNSVVTIGDSAFSSTGLLIIEIPDSVVHIGNDAFASCGDFQSPRTLTIPSSVKTIGDSAFFGADIRPEVVLLGSSLTFVNQTPFDPNEITVIYVESAEALEKLTTVFEENADEFIPYLEVYQVPEKYPISFNGTWDYTNNQTHWVYDCVTFYNDAGEIVTDTAEATQWCIKLGTDIGLLAFYYCSELTSITIPDGVRVIDLSSFTSCTSLVSVSIPSSVETIDSNAFGGCTSLKTLELPNTVSIIRSSAFHNSGLITFTVPSSLATIESNTFDGCDQLETVMLPDTVTEIESSGLANCESLTAVYVVPATSLEDMKFIMGRDNPEVVPLMVGYVEPIKSPISFNGTWNYSSGAWTWANENVTFYNDADEVVTDTAEATQWEIKAGVTEIGGLAFQNCSSLVSIVIPENITLIDGSAFKSCFSMTSVSIPESITEIGTSAFYGCTSLTSVSIPNSVVTIGNNAFARCTGITTLTMSSNVTSIGEAVFERCNKLVSIILPDTLTSLGARAFDGCTLLGNLTIPNSITSIEFATFRDCSSIDSLNIPNSVTSLGSHAFEGCSSLENITLSSSITRIEEETFQGCSAITSITLPDSIVEIENLAFQNCTALASIRLSNSLESINMGAFFGCAMETIELPNSITFIDTWAFQACAKLKSITIPSQLSNLSAGMFEGCSSLVDVTIPNTVLTVGSVEGSSVSYYAGNTFKNCTSLVEITIPDSITEFQVGTFTGCSSLTVIYVNPASSLEPMKLVMGVNNPEAVPLMVGKSFSTRADIGFNGDWDYSANKWVSESVQFYDKDNNVVENTTGAIQWSVVDGVSKVEDASFAGCSQLTAVSIPTTIESVGNGSFSNCSSLNSVSIPTSVKALDNNVFSGCSTLPEVTLPSSVMTIGTGCFNNCESLETIYVEPASSLDSMVAIMNENNPGDVPLLVGAVDPVNVEEIYNKNEELIYPLTHADAVYTIEVSNEGKNKNVSTVLAEIRESQQNVTIELNDKVLSIDSLDRLSAELGLVYDTTNQLIKLTGRDDVEIASFSAGEFIKDAFLKSASYDSTTKELVFVFVDVDKAETITRVDVGDLVDSYTSGNGIDVTNENVINIKVKTDSAEWITASSEGLSVLPIITELDRKNITFLSQPTNYKAGDSWILQAITVVNGVVYQVGEVLTTKTASETYQEAHWSKLNRYLRQEDLQIGSINLFKDTQYPGDLSVWGGESAEFIGQPYEDPSISGFGVRLINKQWRRLWQPYEYYKPNTYYTITAWVKKDESLETGQPTRLSFHRNATNSLIHRFISLGDNLLLDNSKLTSSANIFPILTSEYQKIIWTIFTGDDPYYVTDVEETDIRYYMPFRLEFITEDYENTVPAGLIYGLKVVEGNASTEWSPSPEDVSPVVKNLTTSSTNLLKYSNDISFVANSKYVADEVFKGNLVYGWNNSEGTSYVDVVSANLGRGTLNIVRDSDYFVYSFWAKGTSIRMYLNSDIADDITWETSSGESSTKYDAATGVNTVLADDWKYYWIRFNFKKSYSTLVSLWQGRIHSGESAWISKPSLTKGYAIPVWGDNYPYVIGTENEVASPYENSLNTMRPYSGYSDVNVSSRYVTDFGYDDAIEVTISGGSAIGRGVTAESSSGVIRPEGIIMSQSIYFHNLNDFELILDNNYGQYINIAPNWSGLVEFEGNSSSGTSFYLIKISVPDVSIQELKFNWSRRMVVTGDKVGPFEYSAETQKVMEAEKLSSNFFTGTQAEFDADPNKDNYILASIID